MARGIIRAAGAVDQDAAHDKGRNGDKVSDILEPELGFAAGDPQQGLVKQISRFHARLSNFFSEHHRGAAMEFAIDRLVQRLEGRFGILVEFRYHPQLPPPGAHFRCKGQPAPCRGKSIVFPTRPADSRPRF